MSKAALFAAAVCLTATTAIAQDAPANWANWRGPLYNGISPNGNPPIEWSEEKNIRWKVAIPGKGSASPVIWGDKLFLLTAVEVPTAGEPVSRLDEYHMPPLSLGRGAGGEGSRVTSVAEKSRDTTPRLERAMRPQGNPSPLTPLPKGEGDHWESPTRGVLEPVALLQPERSGRGDAQNQDRPRGRFGDRGRGGPGGRGGFGGGAPPTTPFQFKILCLDRNTGETIWEQTARTEIPHERGHETNTHASASVVTNGNLLYASFGSRGLYCYDLDGKKIWEVDLGDMTTRGNFGEAATPALHGDTLVVPWDHEGDSFVVALDARTGDEKWRADRDEPTTWATPLVVPRGNGFQVVLNGTNRVRSYDLESGELLWECGGQAMNPIPTPVADDERVYVMTGFRGFALYAIPLDAEGDLTETDRIAWKRNEGTPYISSPLLKDGLLYTTKDRNAILNCVEAATGEEVYTNKRLPGLSILYASPVAAAGRIYYFSREGAAVVVKEGREFEILAENKLDETVDASPAIIGDVMYVRGDKSLYAIAED